MRLKGSYTVEAAVIISVSFILFGMAVVLAYELFKESMAYVGQPGMEFDSVRLFRLRENAVDLYNAIRN